MSAPTKDFQDLTLGHRIMPSTRAQARQQAQHGGQSDPSMERQDFPEQSSSGSHQGGMPSPRAFLDQGPRTYDDRFMSFEAWQRATEGLRAHIEMEFCRKIIPPLPQEYFVFQLRSQRASTGSSSRNNEEVCSVMLGRPSSDGYSKPECTCDEFRQLNQARAAACRHIFWLLGKILEVTADESGASFPLLEDGSVAGMPNMFQQLARDGLDSVADTLGWEVKPSESITDPGPTVEEASLETSLQGRRDQMQDILSAFVPGVLPNEYLLSAYNESTRGSDLLDPRSLDTTLFRLAVREDSTFQHLRRVVTPDFCGAVCFRKLGERASLELSRLDDYVRDGPRVSNQDIGRCAARLREVDRLVALNVHSRAPLGPSTKVAVIRMIIHVMEDIWNRDYDIYSDIEWAREVPVAENPVHRNLFVALIGHKYHQGPNFLVDILAHPALRDELAYTNHEDGQPVLDRLRLFRNEIRQTDLAGYKSYAHTLDNLIGEHRRKRGSRSSQARQSSRIRRRRQGEETEQ